jgi:hypothetical protein
MPAELPYRNVSTALPLPGISHLALLESISYAGNNRSTTNNSFLLKKAFKQIALAKDQPTNLWYRS